jgi:hypothetical protein
MVDLLDRVELGIDKFSDARYYSHRNRNPPALFGEGFAPLTDVEETDDARARRCRRRRRRGPFASAGGAVK